MFDKSGQQIGTVTEFSKFVGEPLTKMVCVGRSKVAQPGILRVAPNALVRVEVRGVRRQLFRDNAPMRSQKRLNRFGTIVNPAAIPDDRKRSSQLSPQHVQKTNHIFGEDVFVVGQEVEVEPESAPVRADRDRADGRNPVASIPAIMNRRPPARGKGATNRGREHKARFVEKNKRSAPTPSVFLCVEIAGDANVRSSLRLARGHAARVSATTSPTAGPKVGRRDRRGTRCRTRVESTRLHEAWSTNRFPNHGLVPPGRASVPADDAEPGSSAAGVLSEAWRPVHFCVGPFFANDGLNFRWLSSGEQLPPVYSLRPTAPPRDGDAVPMLSRFLEVS